MLYLSEESTHLEEYHQNFLKLILLLIAAQLCKQYRTMQSSSASKLMLKRNFESQVTKTCRTPMR